MHYTGPAGARYYQNRKKRRNPIMQKITADFISQHIGEVDYLLDFGCGNGMALRNIHAINKIGIEIGAQAAKEARSAGLTIHADISYVEANSQDAIYSYHALEHVPHPYEILTEMHRVLKKGGKLLIVVPADPFRHKKHNRWNEADTNHHLFSWTPLTLGNLIDQAGFRIEHSFVRPAGYMSSLLWLRHAPLLFWLSRHIIARLRSRFETVVVARKASE